MNSIETAEIHVQETVDLAHHQVEAHVISMKQDERRWVLRSMLMGAALGAALDLVFSLVWIGTGGGSWTGFWICAGFSLGFATLMGAVLGGLPSRSDEDLRTHAQALVLFRLELEKVTQAPLGTDLTNWVNHLAPCGASSEEGKHLLALARMGGVRALTSMSALLSADRGFTLSLLRSEADRARTAKVDVGDLLVRAQEESYTLTRLHAVITELARTTGAGSPK